MMMHRFQASPRPALTKTAIAAYWLRLELFPQINMHTQMRRQRQDGLPPSRRQNSEQKQLIVAQLVAGRRAT